MLLFYVLAFLALRHVGSWLPDRGWDPLCWKEKSQPLDHSGSPLTVLFKSTLVPAPSTLCANSLLLGESPSHLWPFLPYNSIHRTDHMNRELEIVFMIICLWGFKFMFGSHSWNSLWFSLYFSILLCYYVLSTPYCFLTSGKDIMGLIIKTNTTEKMALKN